MKRITFAFLLFFVIMTAGNGFGYEVIRTDPVVEITGPDKYKMNQPSDVTVGPRGYIYVLDGVNDRVLSFDSTGELQFSLFHLGREHGSFVSPLGINIDSEGNLLVADSAAGRIVVFGRDGRLKRLYDLPGDRLAADPTDVVSDLEHHYIVDNDNHRILVYRADGTFLNTFGKEGEGPAQFKYPYKIEMDEERRLYVVDVVNARIQILTTSGNYLGQIGRFGVTPGTLFRPNGVAFDKAGRILVSDSYLGVVQAFNRSGEFLGVIGDEHGELLRFKSPAGLFVDERNKLYIVDMPEGKVYVRKIVE